jgi:hypothetical protein
VVQLVQHYNYDEEGLTEMEAGKVVFGVPSDAFYFVDVQYSRDYHQFDAFRHPIVISEEMFPEVWKTKRRIATKNKHKR